jgi:hypothetical protein
MSADDRIEDPDGVAAAPAIVVAAPRPGAG